MKFCDRMNEMLAEKGWKQADLVRVSGMSDAQVYHLCSGRSKNPKLTTLLILMDAFDVTLDELVRDVELPTDAN